MAKYKVGIVSLGCDKNRVDTEILLGSLKNKFEIISDPKEAHIIVVNTCGFIESSKQESINTILEMAEYKKNYKCEVLIATGCLTQRYSKEIAELIPEIDIVLGVNNYKDVEDCIRDFYENKQKIILCSNSNEINEGERVISTGNNYAYLRIGEGCNNNCTYCAIPKIRGSYRSRSIEHIVEEASSIAKMGVKELIIVAQDTTMYGIDLYKKKVLPDLLNRLSQIDDIEWIRLLYCYPEEITDELIEVIASNKKICKYIDIPIQHISNNILKKMGRRGTKEQIVEVINKLKKKVPEITIRTTFIVGFPGETEEDFNELKEFTENIKFDNLGVFRYSAEEGTAAERLNNKISDEIKIQRQNEIMKLQQQISYNNNKGKIGMVYNTLLEDENEEYYIGRSQHMAPDVDGIIYVSKVKGINKGEFVKIKIREALEYDLIGDVYYESSK
ncbi:30S ribosomal protein S12 methylthiotransferase RimO [Clostridium oryzae]|uniref:Ribosomal protein uS12 methylthiotransferase RimO n=1 Tax=Clostridium oryzae TaxID=1450648 RepID=A0A1V4IP45_9CLOT|nr:30S ribosomal protein S12 methylthiotransferase RimO [Clostridium oryzae]OPJ61821.1 ribosomal protein S12 methylthiotransferase RimO [Clostridium oryzae]